MVKIKIEFSDDTVSELKPYFEENNRYRAESGKETWTFEHYVEMILTFGCKSFMLSNARFLNRKIKREMSKKED